jgi:hypothetical protein
MAKTPGVPADKYELDGIEDGLSNDLPTPLRSGCTRNDRSDMHRMGKNQELMVSQGDSSCSSGSLTHRE